jgi:hypothetical protein
MRERSPSCFPSGNNVHAGAAPLVAAAGGRAALQFAARGYLHVVCAACLDVDVLEKQSAADPARKPYALKGPSDGTLAPASAANSGDVRRLRAQCETERAERERIVDRSMHADAGRAVLPSRSTDTPARSRSGPPARRSCLSLSLCPGKRAFGAHAHRL